MTILVASSTPHPPSSAIETTILPLSSSNSRKTLTLILIVPPPPPSLVAEPLEAESGLSPTLGFIFTVKLHSFVSTFCDFAHLQPSLIARPSSRRPLRSVVALVKFPGSTTAHPPPSINLGFLESLIFLFQPSLQWQVNSNEEFEELGFD